MDHIGVLKRAWKVTWRYRILWLFGLFAGGAGGGGGGGGGGGSSWTPSPDSEWLPTREIERVGWWLQDNIALIVAVVAFFAVLGLGMFILSIAAKGGLVFLVNEAEEERPVRGMDGWAAGFRAWFKVFGIGFVLFVPYMVLMLAVLVATLAPIIRPFISGGQPGLEAFVGMCGGLALGGLVLLLLGILIGVLDTLAVRYAVLDGRGVFSSIGAAWTDVRTRFKDVFVMWLLMIAVGLAFGVVIGVAAAIFGFGIVAAILAEEFVVAGVVGFALFIFLLLPTAIYGAFTSAVWTVFFRRLTGREVIEAAASPGYTPPLVPGAPADTPPAPPAAPSPPAAPYAPAPPAAPYPPGPPVAPPPDTSASPPSPPPSAEERE
ncbi:MAG: hypothetical protein K0B85_04895 [Coriobacteriia bacterium]|nr:hypothetical protein [Coriobacteriia bacterium]